MHCVIMSMYDRLVEDSFIYQGRFTYYVEYFDWEHDCLKDMSGTITIEKSVLMCFLKEWLTLFNF